MKTFLANDSNDMARMVYDHMSVQGVEHTSRNGRVLYLPYPVILGYRKPMNRANFTPGRDANPFFHIAEAMWMLAGRQDVEFLDIFNSQMRQYSDDGEVFNAAYGYRMRHHFGFDQLHAVVDQLVANPDTRQAVIQMWDPNDLSKDTKDKACNMSLVFSYYGNQIDLMVFNRSNDAVYGNVTGANPVHMSYFLQWVCDQLDADVGMLYFTTNNLHVYLDLYDHWDKMSWNEAVVKYDTPHIPMGGLEEIEQLCGIISNKDITYHTYSPHIEKVVKPILNAWIARKYYQEDPNDWLEKCEDLALRTACTAWLEKRK